MQYLIYKYSKGPNISFRPINIREQPFRGHVDGATNVDVLETFFGSFEFLSKPKICNLSNSVTEEYVRYFEISMNDLVVTHVLHGRECFVYQFACLQLREWSPVSDSALEIAFVTKLGNNITVVVARENLDTVEDVRMF